MGKEIRFKFIWNELNTDRNLWIQLKTSVCKTLVSGGVCILPTETSYMLAGNATNYTTVQRIKDLKNRPDLMDFSCAFSTTDLVKSYVEWSPQADQLYRRFMPGPLTLVLPQKKGIKIAASQSDTLAVRVPGFMPLLEILSELKFPVTATSANSHGGPEPYRMEECVDGVDCLWDAGVLQSSLPSTIVALKGERLQVIRQGAITEEQIRSVLMNTAI